MRGAAPRFRSSRSGLWLPTRTDSFASCPDPGAFPGDIDIRWFGQLGDVPSLVAGCTLAGQWGAAPQQSWSFDYNTGGFCRMQVSTTGSNSLSLTDSTAALQTMGLRTGDAVGLRANLTISNLVNKIVRYLLSLDDGKTWTDFGGATLTNLLPVAASTAVLSTGVRTGDNVRPNGGRTDRLEVRAGIDGTVIASPDFSAQPRGSGWFKDAQGNAWSLNGDARIAA